MVTYNKILKILEKFAISHKGVQRFMAHSEDELSEMVSKYETFPVIFVHPLNGVLDDFQDSFELRVYCIDRRTKDKSNFNPTISDTAEVLRDLDVWLRESYQGQQIEVNTLSTLIPFENELMDDVDGWYMDMTLDIDVKALCDIPFSEPITPTYGCGEVIVPECKLNFYICDELESTHTLIQY